MKVKILRAKCMGEPAARSALVSHFRGIVGWSRHPSRRVPAGLAIPTILRGSS